MEKNQSYIAFIQGIEAVISKCRASLTVKEIEMLEEIKTLLHEMDQKEYRQDKQLLVLGILMKLSSFLLHPENLEQIKNLIHQFL